MYPSIYTYIHIYIYITQIGEQIRHADRSKILDGPGVVEFGADPNRRSNFSSFFLNTGDSRRLKHGLTSVSQSVAASPDEFKLPAGARERLGTQPCPPGHTRSSYVAPSIRQELQV